MNIEAAEELCKTAAGISVSDDSYVGSDCEVSGGSVVTGGSLVEDRSVVDGGAVVDGGSLSGTTIRVIVVSPETDDE